MEYAVYWLIALVVLLVIEAATLGLATISVSYTHLTLPTIA